MKEEADHESSSASESPERQNDAAKDREVSISTEEALPVQQETAHDSTLGAWSRVFAAWLLFAIAWGPALAFGEFVPYYTTVLLKNKSTSDIAWIGSFLNLLLVTAGVITGPLFDQGYLKHLMALGSVLLVLGYMMLSLATEYYSVMLTQGLVAGIGSGLLYVPGLAFVNVSFKERRAIAVAVTTTGTSVGGIIFPILVGHMIPKVGFPWTCRTIAFIQLFCGIVANTILYFAPAKKIKPRSLIDTRAFKSATFLCYCVTLFTQFLSYWVPLFFLPSYGVYKLGMSKDMASYLLVFINAASIPGRIAPAFVAQRYGPVNVVVVCTGIVAVITFCWIAVDTVAGQIVWCLLWGGISGVFISVTPLVVSHPLITPSMDVYGTRLGMAWMAAGVGVLIGNPIATTLADPAHGKFLHAQIFAGAILMGGWIISFVPWYRMTMYNRRLKEPQSETPNP